MHHGVEIPEGKGSGCRAVGLSSAAADISGVLGGSGEPKKQVNNKDGRRKYMA